VAELDDHERPLPEFRVRLDDVTEPDDPGAVVVRVSGDLDIAAADEGRAVVEQALARAPQQLIFDLSDLRFMDSSGIAVLVAAAQKVRTVIVRNPSTTIRRLLTIAGLDEVFTVTP
jgi:anti-sigma B factor antagonist